MSSDAEATIAPAEDVADIVTAAPADAAVDESVDVEEQVSDAAAAAAADNVEASEAVTDEADDTVESNAVAQDTAEQSETATDDTAAEEAATPADTNAEAGDTVQQSEAAAEAADDTVESKLDAVDSASNVEAEQDAAKAVDDASPSTDAGDTQTTANADKPVESPNATPVASATEEATAISGTEETSAEGESATVTSSNQETGAGDKVATADNNGDGDGDATPGGDDDGSDEVGLNIQHEMKEHEIRYAAEDAAIEAAKKAAEEEAKKPNITTPRLDQDKKIQAFMDRVQAKTLLVTVSDPREQKPKFGKPYVEYLVRTIPEEGTDWMVRRRYSDFEWLRAVLKKKYVGMIIPPLPKKRTINTFISSVRTRLSGMFVQLRTRALNVFMTAVARIDFLKEDPDLKDFLEIQDDKEWEKTKKLKKDANLLFTSFAENFAPSESVDVWRAAVTSFEQPPNWNRHLKDYKGQVEQLFNALTAVKEANKNLFECKIKTTAAVGAFCDAFGSVSKAEQQCGDKTRVEFANPEIDDGFVAFLEDSEGILRDWQRLLQFESAANQLLVHETLKFHESQLEEVLDLFKRQEEADSAFKKETKELMKAKGKQENMDLALLQEKMDNAAKNFECCNKAFMFSEIDRFCVEKRRLFKELVACDTLVSWTSNNRFQARWEEFLQRSAEYCVGGDDTLIPDYMAKMKELTKQLPIDSLMEAQRVK